MFDENESIIFFLFVVIIVEKFGFDNEDNVRNLNGVECNGLV